MEHKDTTVITRAANGIGQAYAQRLAADGFDIAVADVADAAQTKEPRALRTWWANTMVVSGEVTLTDAEKNFLP